LKSTKSLNIQMTNETNCGSITKRSYIKNGIHKIESDFKKAMNDT
jgi:hypothetical protein